jgi:plastocyanin
MRVHHALLLATLGLGCGGSSSSTTTPAAVASVVIFPGTDILTFTPGSRIDLTATAKDASGATLTAKVPTWTTTNAAILTVSTSAAGVATVTAVAIGTAQVVATSDAKTATVNITVVPQVFTQVSVSPPSKSLAPPATQTLTATAVDQNGLAMAGTGFGAPAFSSSNTAVATVDAASGVVTAVANGAATVSASVVGAGVTKTGTSAITVAAGGGFPTSAVVEANGTYGWDPSSVDIAAGGTVTFVNQTPYTHNVTFTDAAGVPAGIADWIGDSRGSSFPTAGTFTYHCGIHPGMKGTVVVH